MGDRMYWKQLLDPPWWTYDPDAGSIWSEGYHAFNLFEAACWLVFAGLVIGRWMRHRRSCWELVYAAAFATFGLSDLREAWVQSAPLVAFKGVNLLALWLLRRRSLTAWYLEASIY